MNSAPVIELNGSSDIEAFLQPQAWIQMNPALSIANVERMKNISPVTIDAATADSLEGWLVREGYFHIPTLQWDLPLAEMSQAIVRLTERGLVPPFCFMYDEFWMMYSRLHQIFVRLLGPGYVMLPDFWAWYVDHRAANSGWKPHRDKNYKTLFPDGRPKSLTVWIPLTDATPLNSCIYIIPAHRDPTYGTDQDKVWKFEAQDIRALPSPAGGLLVWNSAVVHWGSHSSPLAAGPRISVAFEFQRGDVPPLNTPLLPPLACMTVHQRLALICKQILQYRHMYPLTPELQKLAEAMARRGAIA